MRLIIDVAFGNYVGKGTGERALMKQLLDRLPAQPFLFLLDAGLYALELLWLLDDRRQAFLVKVPATVKLKRLETYPDGSYLALLSGKIEDPEQPKTDQGRTHWKKVKMVVRIIDYAIPGFRPARLMTNLLDPDITARDLALHYHKRWDIEIAYDEIKTHQCATLTGQSPTTFRSKRPDLVEQELYATLIMYNLVRLLIGQAATAHLKDPRFISFLDALHHITDVAPLISILAGPQRTAQFSYLLALIADCDIDRPRRHRLNPRVIKVTRSKFKRKRKEHHSTARNLEKELVIIGATPQTSQALLAPLNQPPPPHHLLPLLIIVTWVAIASGSASDRLL